MKEIKAKMPKYLKVNTEKKKKTGKKIEQQKKKWRRKTKLPLKNGEKFDNKNNLKEN